MGLLGQPRRAAGSPACVGHAQCLEQVLPLPTPATWLWGCSLRRKGVAVRQKSPTAKGFAGLKGCVFFRKDKICWVIKHTQTQRLLPGDKGIFHQDGRAREFSSLSLSFFSSSLNLDFSSLEVTALIEPRDQQQEADLLTENGKVKKRGGGRGSGCGGLIPDTASNLRVG